MEAIYEKKKCLYGKNNLEHREMWGILFQSEWGNPGVLWYSIYGLSWVQYYLLSTGESYSPTAQHMQDSPIFFIQLNYVHNIKDKVLPPYGKFPCHKVAQHWEFHFLFLNPAILHSCNFGHSCLYLLKSPSILAIH